MGRPLAGFNLKLNQKPQVTNVKNLFAKNSKNGDIVGKSLKSNSKNVVDSTNFTPDSKITPLERRGFVKFDDVEFRGVRDLSHMETKDLLKMSKTGVAPLDLSGQPLRGHHHLQKYHRYEGAFIVEMPHTKHNVNNVIQHPHGNKKGHG